MLTLLRLIYHFDLEAQEWNHLCHLHACRNFAKFSNMSLQEIEAEKDALKIEVADLKRQEHEPVSSFSTGRPP